MALELHDAAGGVADVGRAWLMVEVTRQDSSIWHVTE